MSNGQKAVSQASFTSRACEDGVESSESKNQRTRGDFRRDLEAYYLKHYGTTSPGIGSRIKLWAKEFGLHCVAVYRFGWFARRLSKKNRIIAAPFLLAHTLLNYLAIFFHHVHINKAEIGPGFTLEHVGTILIGPTTIGRNFRVAHNVTIGWGHSDEKPGLPVIGDNVYIGTGSVVYGGITVGNGSTICNGCILSRVIPDNSLVAGNPGRVVKLGYDNRHIFLPPKEGLEANPEA